MADSINWGSTDEEKATGHINVIDYSDQAVINDADTATKRTNQAVYARGRFLKGTVRNTYGAIESRGGWLTYGTQ
jgi:hypothetical protein